MEQRGERETGLVPRAVLEELEILERALRAIRENPAVRAREDYRATLVRLRESLTDERQLEDMASIVEQMERVGNILRQVEIQAAQQADPDNPYFGHLRVLDEEGRERDILVGRRTYIRGEVAIVDWRDAPIARVFYHYREGEDYVMHLDRKEVEGEVLVRRTVTIQSGALVRVGAEEEDFVWDEEAGAWVDATASAPRLQGGAGVAHRPESDPIRSALSRRLGRRALFDKHLPEIASLLDREQYGLITSRDAGIIAVQGSAGSGKTTVALHRVAYLAFLDPRRYAPEQSVVVVYSRALARYISRVLPDLGVPGAPVVTFEEWGMRQLARHVPAMPRLLSERTPSPVCRFKQHAGLLGALGEAAAGARGASVQKLFDELFTSRRWIADTAARFMPGVLSETEIEEVYRWCAHLHALRVADEPREITDDDEGADDDREQPQIDAEDVAVLLRLHQLVRGPLEARRGRALLYAHLVIDEVQDMAPVELAVLLDTVRRGHPVTLAGDLAQQLDDDNDFQSWAYVAEHLGEHAVNIRPLQISYRSTEPIMRAALAVLAHLAPDEPPRCARDGDPVELFEFAGSGEAFTFLSDMLQDLLRREPNAAVAVLARYTHQADAAFHALSRAGVLRLRRVEEEDFEFTPGVEIAEIHQTKGLEFDYVVILDVDAHTFPANNTARRVLHVGMTRAAHLCWLISTGERSPILPDWLRATSR